jgi:hypothetical protein
LVTWFCCSLWLFISFCLFSFFISTIRFCYSFCSLE